MRLGFHGELRDDPVVRVGFIGCGSHAFRNIYPALQFVPLELVAVCDLQPDRAAAFARQFGAERAYHDHRAMLATEDLDAVLIVTNYDEAGRPRFPALAADCLRAGCHVWMEKPPAASSAELTALQELSAAVGRQVMVGLKKMFVPANEHAAWLLQQPDFGPPQVVTLMYPQHLPTVEQFRAWRDERQPVGAVVGFLDHLCHPAALLVYLLGLPQTLYYERSAAGAGVAVFSFASGTVASLHLSGGAPTNGGLEQTVIVGRGGRRIVVSNNTRVEYHRDPPGRPGEGYGSTPSFFRGAPSETAAVWQPEFSLGQLYNKGLFLLGYYGELQEFATALLEQRPVAKGTLTQAWQVTRLFEAFAAGPRQVIPID
ncbi:MAG: Gfo/Idh/MocA family oxidoreductase [Fimbriimonadaceae bacterium]|nr:Gfo/Idh/MocA family oxidoreductase [Fimbriimonadaceae bacterium]